MAFTRAGNRDTFLRRAGYTSRLTDDNLEQLQRDIESGSLLQRYDLNTGGNLTRYHRQTPPLVGSNSPAPNSPTYATLDHMIVSQIDPATATSPRGVSVQGVWETVAQYLPFRDLFYHRDKQREVAKGLEDLYKELQRVQTETATPHPTNPGLIITTKRKLTSAEAGKIISQRRYKTVRSTLEQLAVDMGYVGEIDVETATPSPYGYGAPVVPAVPAPPVYRTPTPDDIRQSYGRVTINPRTWLQAIPDEVLAGVRTVALTGIIASAAVGSYVPLAMYAGGRLASGATASAVSHVVRQHGRDYITTEDGIQNAAELAGKLGGLAAYGATASAVAGGLALTWVTGCLAGSAVTRYVGNKRRQQARDLQRQLEDITQTGANDPALRARIDSTVLSAEKYEAASAGLDILSLLSMGVGGLRGLHLPIWTSTPDTTAPTIDHITTQTAVHVGDDVKYSFDVHDLPNSGHVEQASITIQDPTRHFTSQSVYPDSVVERIQHTFGDSNITEHGTIHATHAGQYTVTINASDGAGNTATPQTFTFTVTDGTSPVTPGPVVPTPIIVPVPCEDGHIPYNTNLAGTNLELREVYDYHHTPLIAEKGHEQGLHIASDWKSGTVTVGPHDEHTPCDFNVDDTVVMFEHYNAGTVGHKAFTDASLNTPDYRVLVDVDASGHFVIPDEFKHASTDSYQITWAQMTHSDCANGQLGLEDLASVTHGQHVVVSKEAVFDGSVPAHVPPHYITCEEPAVPVHPAPVVPETPVTPDVGNIHYYQITPVPDHGAFLLNITDNRFDGINNTTEIYSGDHLVQWSQDTFAEGTTTAIVGGHYPVDLHAGDYRVHSWGHDNPNIAWDNKEFIVSATEQHVAPAHFATSASFVSADGGLETVVGSAGVHTTIEPTTAVGTVHIAPVATSESTEVGSSTAHIAPAAEFESSETGSALPAGTTSHIAPAAGFTPTEDCGCDGSSDAYMPSSDAIAQMSYEEIQQLMQAYYNEYYKIIEIA